MTAAEWPAEIRLWCDGDGLGWYIASGRPRPPRGVQRDLAAKLPPPEPGGELVVLRGEVVAGRKAVPDGR